MKKSNKLLKLISAAAAVLLLGALLCGCGRGGLDKPDDTQPPAEATADMTAEATAEATDLPTSEPTEAPEETCAPSPTPSPDEEGLFSRYGRSDRIPEYLGEQLYRDYRAVMDSLYNGESEAALTYCRSAEDFSKLSACVKLMFVPRDLLRDPSFLTVTPFDFDAETGIVSICYCWEDGTFSEDELPCRGREEYLEKIAEFEAIVEGILTECGIGFEDGEADALSLFEWTADNLYYEINRNDSAYTAFLNRRAYCSIYACVYQYLCEQAGVRCMRVSGATQMGWGDHEWDMILLNENWYHADATAQGSDNYAPGYWFGMTDAACAKLGYGSVENFSLSDELNWNEERPVCADGKYDELYRSWLELD